MAIRGMCNMGPSTERVLVRAGIATEGQLREAGAVGAYLAVTRTGMNPGLNLLWVIQGALSGCHWRDVPNRERLALLKQLQTAVGNSCATTGR